MQEYVMKKILIYISVLILYIYTPTAEAENNIFGVGATSCGEMVALTGGPYDNFDRVSWISGYISALNAEYGLTKGVDKSWESIYYAVLNRCKDTPLELMPSAILYVYINEL
mgnify:CR=1 FL=1|tara:strand:+ start:242 stop:577 length:336 start_codon:yes stop_codon:yes gene_type:complete